MMDYEGSVRETHSRRHLMLSIMYNVVYHIEPSLLRLRSGTRMLPSMQIAPRASFTSKHIAMNY